MVPKQLNQKIDNKELPLVMVLFGEQINLMKLTKKKLKHYSQKMGKEFLNFDLSEDSLTEVIDTAQEVSLLSSGKVIMVNDALFVTGAKNNQSESSINSLLAYLDQPNPGSIVVFSAATAKLDQRKKIVKALKQKATVVEYGKVPENEIIQIVRRILKKHEILISRDAERFLLNYVRLDYDLIERELGKVVEFGRSGTEIQVSDLQELLFFNAETNIFNLVNIYFKQDNERKIVEEYEHLISDGTEPLALIGLLLSNLRQLLSIKIITQNKNLTQAEVSKRLKLHPFIVQKALSTIRQLEFVEISDFYSKLYQLQLDFKQGRINDLVDPLELALIKQK